MPYLKHISRALHACWRLVPLVIMIFVFAALAVRLSVRDRLPLLSLLFYATPLAVLALLSCGAAFLWLYGRRWRLAAFAAFVGIATACWWHATSFSYHPEPPGQPGKRMVFWNVARGRFGWSRVTESLREFDADLIGLVEAESKSAKTGPLWRSAFPEYQVCGPKYGLLLMARGEVVEKEMGDLDHGGEYVHYEVSLKDETFDVLLVDIKSSLLLSREPAINKLIEVIDRFADRPLLVLGDFNTPVDSVFIEPLAERLTNVFEACGNGYNTTWPIPLPVLSIDQVWASTHFKLRSCELPWTSRSDHRPIVLDLQAEGR